MKLCILLLIIYISILVSACQGTSTFNDTVIFDPKLIAGQISQLPDDKLCNLALNDSHTDWDNRYPLHVAEAKKRGLNCGIGQTINYTNNVFSLCLSATRKNSNNVLKWDHNAKGAIEEIYRLNLTCGLQMPNDLIAAYAMTDQDICKRATTALGWNKARSLYTNEARRRNLHCNISAGISPDTTEIVRKPTFQKRYSKKMANRDIAIIIGSRNYLSNGRDIPDVAPAIRDAQSFKLYASNILGINSENIIFLEDATSADLERTFGNERSHKGDAFNWVREGKSNLYVYYAGHGAPGENGSSYLVPTDASADAIDLNGYPLETLYKNLSMISSKSTTVILESCFSGNSQSGTVITNASPVYMKAKDTTIPSNLTVLTAGSPNQLASWTKDIQNGLFTHHYIRGMNGEADGPNYGNADGKVSMSELKNYLDDTVTYYARRNYGRSQNVQITLAQ